MGGQGRREMIEFVGKWVSCIWIVAVGLWLGPSAAATDETARVVSREEILEAMRLSSGYTLTATANGPRLQAEVVLHIIREAERTDPGRRPLRFGHRAWYEAFLARTGLAPEEAPIYVRRPFEVGQDLVVDYRRERVIDEVVKGPEPRIAANVRISWPDIPGKPESFSYEDLLSDPHLKVTQKRLIRYRLVEYVDRIWYAEVSGLHGRPTSGVLGLFFALLGEARVVESRSAFSPDGLQVVRGRAHKLVFTRVGTVTVWPDGHAEPGVPEDRPDLRPLEERLKEPLEIRFQPLDQPEGEWTVTVAPESRSGVAAPRAPV
jgi:hypothetical protein